MGRSWHLQRALVLPVIGSYHLGMVGCYFSVTLGKDLYSQSEGESCLGMLQGCFVLFCLPCNSLCACGGMTTTETTFPPSNLWWLWLTCSPFIKLQGCVEHEVCGRDMTEENTCFFWLAHDADPIVWMAASGNHR